MRRTEQWSALRSHHPGITGLPREGLPIMLELQKVIVAASAFSALMYFIVSQALFHHIMWMKETAAQLLKFIG